ncbi:hypothetical protein N7510_006908 [Penicillium lagena]|uniref:uncharacterized protein n=1 Tax=Penicillium lagena TaxID=94218 RepID=UPI002540229C|nr:uncharacterized protein N7510_006908 [Penicillium lagena]KAJ5610189.1 hypothetical protein N7510_006908 [Penicillium lagena]
MGSRLVTAAEIIVLCSPVGRGAETVGHWPPIDLYGNGIVEDVMDRLPSSSLRQGESLPPLVRLTGVPIRGPLHGRTISHAPSIPPEPPDLVPIPLHDRRSVGRAWSIRRRWPGNRNLVPCSSTKRVTTPSSAVIFDIRAHDMAATL